MQEGSGSKYYSKISVESLKSRNSNSVSLGRPSWTQRNPSLNKKVSLVYVMSIESDRKSDIYERMLEQNIVDQQQLQHNQSPWNRNSLENNQMYVYDNNNEIRRNSYQSRPILHECDCYQVCSGQECPCFKSRNEMCLKQSCCETCIQMKNAMLLADRGQFCTCKNTQCLKSYCKCFQNNGVCTSMCRCQDCRNKIDSVERQQAVNALKYNTNQIQKRHCTCKKTKCNKKYCSCYAMGVKCTKYCQCQNCINCDRANQPMDIEQPPQFIEDQDLSGIQFPQRMSFEKPEFIRY